MGAVSHGFQVLMSGQHVRPGRYLSASPETYWKFGRAPSDCALCTSSIALGRTAQSLWERGKKRQWRSYLQVCCCLSTSAGAYSRIRRENLEEVCPSSQRGEVQRLCDEGQLHKTLDALVETGKQGIAPSVGMYKSLLKACSKRHHLVGVRQVHAHMVEHGMEATSSLGEFLVCAFMQCHAFEHALQLHHSLPLRTVVSWTAVIVGLTKAGKGHEALRAYRCMQEEGVEPDEYTLSSVLKVCGSIGNLAAGKHIHAQAVKYNCESSLVVGTCLVDMYAKCGSTLDARAVFDGLVRRDVVSWTAMLAGYTHHERADDALNFYEQLRAEGVVPNAQTFVSVLQACARLAETEGHCQDGRSVKIQSLQKGKAIHADARRMGIAAHPFVGNAIVSMYFKCGSVLDAWHSFEGLPCRDIVSWNAMLAGHVQGGLADEGLGLYSRLSEAGFSPNARTFVTSLQACAMMAEEEEGVSIHGLLIRADNLARGKELHAVVWNTGYKQDAFISSMLVCMYGKCGSIADAEDVFHRLLDRDTATSTAMMMAYSQLGYPEKALKLYEEEVEEGSNSAEGTFTVVIQACGMVAEKEEETIVEGHPVRVYALQKGRAIHAAVLRGHHESDGIVANALVSMYGKCGSIVDAENVFKSLSFRDLMSWNVMLAAYCRQGLMEDALLLRKLMQEQGASPNEVTFLHILEGCSKTGSLDLCVRIHSDVVASQESMSPVLASALINAYGRCGCMAEARAVFDRLVHPAVVSWNALVAGYVRQGDCETLFGCYQEMLLSGLQPNGITFLSLISACSHAGMVDKGLEYFESMSRDYGITPAMEHYVSIVDLLGRAGHFQVVQNLLSEMPLQPNLSLWMCLLGACQKHRNVRLARYAFDCAVDLQPMVTSAYVLMANIFGDARMWSHVTMVNELRQNAGLHKQPGQSWIEYEQKLFRFGVCCPQQDVHELVRNLSAGINRDQLASPFETVRGNNSRGYL